MFKALNRCRIRFACLNGSRVWRSQLLLFKVIWFDLTNYHRGFHILAKTFLKFAQAGWWQTWDLLVYVHFLCKAVPKTTRLLRPSLFLLLIRELSFSLEFLLAFPKIWVSCETLKADTFKSICHTLGSVTLFLTKVKIHLTRLTHLRNEHNIPHQ